MRKINYAKVFWNGVPLKRIAVGATWFETLMARFVRVMRWVVIASFIGGVAVGSYKIGGTTVKPVTVFADKEVIKEVEGPSAVMDRIMKCESAGHYAKNGQVQFHANKDGTVDIGAFQINSIWDAQATKLGYNLTIEKDNIAFAMWLYKNKGTEPWYSSKKCWNK